MNEEKRKIGEYTVLCSVNVGEKEVILASNEQSTNGDKFMCGFAERNDLFELCSECMVSDDYIEIVHLFGSRVANEAELFKEQVEKLDIPIILITEADCIPDHYSKDINGKIIAIDPKVLKPEFQRATDSSTMLRAVSVRRQTAVEVPYSAQILTPVNPPDMKEWMLWAK